MRGFDLSTAEGEAAHDDDHSARGREGMVCGLCGVQVRSN